LSTGSFVSLVLLGRGGGGDVTRVEGVDKSETGWAMGMDPHPLEAGPKVLNVCKKVTISSLCTL
jgi:hypothetical protein